MCIELSMRNSFAKECRPSIRLQPTAAGREHEPPRLKRHVEPTLRVVSTAPRMVIRRLAREARPNQRLQRTSAAQTSFAPRPPLIRGAVRRHWRGAA